MKTTAAGGWWLVVGGRQSTVGGWQLAVGGWPLAAQTPDRPFIVRLRAYSLQRTASFLLGIVLFTAAACQKPTTPRTGAATKGIDPAADQVVFGSRTLVTDGGLRRAEVHSDTALFYEDNTRMDMRIVNVVFYNSGGAKEAVLTSRKGQYLTRDGVLEARGMVVITTVDGRKLTSEQVKFDQRVNQISSDSAFVLTEDGRQASGIGFVSDPDMNNIRIFKGSRAKAGQVQLPNP